MVGTSIRRHILSALGRPEGLFRVGVYPLWDDHYRVNVLVGADAARTRIAHSFFVEAREDGTILSTCPPITRSYP